ncbi:hypothetical protein S40285_10816 [Stachybotrys chlorohalonatus IBT 40285]|uniref:Uncharacterized protein n=1 Tax=Stachybotrys chlorohalonatus (strain IBT 40285) TaxID=1283841 RepID=A0A084QTB5_STAC4|nr:hypothetical protein S40285_10816 [Stachybotrys chlorohalonata IBT 40285]
MMQRDREIYSQHTQRRIEAYTSKRQRGAIVKSNTEGHVITSISKGELLEKAFLEQLLNTLAQQGRQLSMTRNLMIKEPDDLDLQWRESKVAQEKGGKGLTFAARLEENQASQTYVDLKA